MCWAVASTTREWPVVHGYKQQCIRAKMLQYKVQIFRYYESMQYDME